MTYDKTNEGTQFLVGVIFQKLAPDFIGNFNPVDFCVNYSSYRKNICENLFYGATICACGYTRKKTGVETTNCPVCGKRVIHEKSRLATHIALSETVSDFVELYKEKYYTAE